MTGPALPARARLRAAAARIVQRLCAVVADTVVRAAGKMAPPGGRRGVFGLSGLCAVELLVHCQAARTGKGTATVHPGADKRLSSCMHPAVYVQGVAPCEGFSTVRLGADKALFSRMDPLVFS